MFNYANVFRIVKTHTAICEGLELGFETHKRLLRLKFLNELFSAFEEVVLIHAFQKNQCAGVSQKVCRVNLRANNDFKLGYKSSVIR